MKTEDPTFYKLEEKIDSLVNSLTMFKEFSRSNDTTITENFRILEDRIMRMENHLGFRGETREMTTTMDMTWMEEKVTELSNKVNYFDNKITELDAKVSSLQYEIPKGFIEILEELKKIQIDTAYQKESSNGTSQMKVKELETPVVEF